MIETKLAILKIGKYKQQLILHSSSGNIRCFQKSLARIWVCRYRITSDSNQNYFSNLKKSQNKIEMNKNFCIA